MRFFKRLFWFLLVIALIAFAMYVTGNYELSDRLTSLYLAIQPWLPLKFNFDQFLILATVVSFLALFLAIGSCVAALMFMGTRLSLVRQKQWGQAEAAKREVTHLKEQYLRQQEQIVAPETVGVVEFLVVVHVRAGERHIVEFSLVDVDFPHGRLDAAEPQGLDGHGGGGGSVPGLRCGLGVFGGHGVHRVDS